MSIAPDASMTRSAPSPPVSRFTAATGSSVRALITASAPKRVPYARRLSRVPTRIVWPAPSALQSCTVISPTGPGPITTTDCPAMKPPAVSSPYKPVPAVVNSTASSQLTLSGSL